MNINKMKRALPGIIILISCVSLCAEDYNPWEWDVLQYIPDTVVTFVYTPEPQLYTEGHPFKFITIKLINFYQKYLSPIKEGHCIMEPTCSVFSKRAIQKYGPVWGILMTIDRIYYRENDSIKDFYPLIQTKDLVLKYYDPVENNYILGEKKYEYVK